MWGLREHGCVLVTSVRKDIGGEQRILCRKCESYRLGLVDDSLVVGIASNVDPGAVVGS
jgi:hypothetical protein